MSNLPISFDDVVAAQKRLGQVSHRTPVLTSSTADQMTGAQVFFKCENLQRTGAFKFRGAYNSISQFSPEQIKNGVITYSSGNHAQAVALAARLMKTKAVIIMPEDAPEIKIKGTLGYGGEVVKYNRAKESREEIGQKLAAERNLTLIPPFNHRHVMAGQGTLALEFFEEVKGLDFLLTPLSGGGLLSGCATVAKKLNPKIKVIGVEPEAGNDGQQSFRSGKIVRIDLPKTIADGAQTQSLGELTFSVIHELVDDVVTVSDSELVQAMEFFATRMKIMVEPTGCLAAAAVFQKKVDVKGKRVGVVLSGGNVDLDQFASLTKSSVS